MQQERSCPVILAHMPASPASIKNQYQLLAHASSVQLGVILCPSKPLQMLIDTRLCTIRACNVRVQQRMFCLLQRNTFKINHCVLQRLYYYCYRRVGLLELNRRQ